MEKDPDKLIHNIATVETDATLFDQLCSFAIEGGRDVVWRRLVAETRAAAADALESEAREALQFLLRDPLERDDTFVRELEKRVDPTDLNPDEEEVSEYTRDMAQALMSAWLEELRVAAQRELLDRLSDELCPTDDIDGYLTRLTEAVSFLPMRASDVRDVMLGVRRQMTEFTKEHKAKRILLPFGFFLDAEVFIDRSGRPLYGVPDGGRKKSSTETDEN